MFAKRAQSVSIPNAALSVAVVFSSPMPSADYGIAAQFLNALGAPIYQEIIIRLKSANGFTAEWPAPLDSGDYFLDYIAYVPDLGETTGDVARKMGFNALTPSDVGKNVIFPTPFPDALYSVACRFSNELDPGPQYQSLVVTSKSMNGFVVEWPAPVDSNNYRLEFLATPWS